MAQAWLHINAQDNVAVALRDMEAGESIAGVTLAERIPAGHKAALVPIATGADIIKYGAPIGHAAVPIAPGAWVHTHNVKTNLDGLLAYAYTPAQTPQAAPPAEYRTFEGYLRADGRVGIRNELWIICTVGCVNQTAARIAKEANARFAGMTEGIHHFPHPYGCSQLGDDHARTQQLLAALVRHPNAGGVLVLGLGCENNHIEAFREALGDVDGARVRFVNAQDEADELEAGLDAVEALVQAMQGDVRTAQPVSKLVIGLKCGGSDGLSGITANPLVGRISDWVCAGGGTALLSEVPEMFGAETLLMRRCVDEAVFQKTVAMINDYKAYFLRYGQVVYENPSPGNKAGGITTLEDKSLGCTQKGGTSLVADVLAYAEPVRKSGLNLVYGPGNDICSVTGLAAAGAQLILFTTGRGTPLGGPVPTLKLATNTALAARKPHWIDFNAGVLVEDTDMAAAAQALQSLVLDTASGRQTQNEQNGYREIAIFKDGVTL